MDEPYPMYTHVSWANGDQTGSVLLAGKRPGEDTWTYYVEHDDAGSSSFPSANLTVIT